MSADRKCGSPALRKHRYCYFHQPGHARRARIVAERGRQRWFDSVKLENPKAVQKALSQVIRRIMTGQIEHKRAGDLLFRLQIAAKSFAIMG
jgi:hypothetical protein